MPIDYTFMDEDTKRLARVHLKKVLANATEEGLDYRWGVIRMDGLIKPLARIYEREKYGGPSGQLVIKVDGIMGRWEVFHVKVKEGLDVKACAKYIDQSAKDWKSILNRYKGE